MCTHVHTEKKNESWAVVVHAFNPSTWEAEVGGSLSSRLAWSTQNKQQKEKDETKGFLPTTSPCFRAPKSQSVLSHSGAGTRAIPSWGCCTVTVSGFHGIGIHYTMTLSLVTTNPSHLPSFPHGSQVSCPHPHSRFGGEGAKSRKHC